MISKDQRLNWIKSIKSAQNEQRKALSLKQSEIMNDRLFQYVEEELKRHFSPETVKEMPIVSFINFPRRIVNQEASVYKNSPMRTFTGLNEQQSEVVSEVYEDARIDVKMRSANKKYKLQDQTHLYILPVNGVLQARSLYQHQIDAIPDPRDPERAMGYVISAFDKERYLTYQNAKTATGRLGQSQIGTTLAGTQNEVASKDDYKLALEFYTYWDEEHNFIMNGNGDLIDPTTREIIQNPEESDWLSPIPGIIPIVDISSEKDFEYFVRSGLAISDFGVQYNAALSDAWHLARMQGYSIGVIKGPADMIPNHMVLGPNVIMRLVTEPGRVESGDVDFDFKSPNPDIEGTLKILETMLMNFISSRGLDPKEIASTGSKSYASALERMLAMIDEFEASKDDFKLFKRIEDQIYRIIKAYLNNAPDQLLAKYRTSIPDESYLTIKFDEPEMVQTKSERLDYWAKRIDMGLATRQEAIADLDDLNEEQADMAVELINRTRFGATSENESN